MHETASNRARRVAALKTVATANGFTVISDSRFSKGGKTYDLSAADLSQLDRIEREELFLVD